MASYLKGKPRRVAIINNPANFDPGNFEASSDDESPECPVVPKTEAETTFLTTALKDHYVFSGLSAADLLNVIHRMCRSTKVKSETIIMEGAEGDRFYVLHSGRAEIRVKAAGGKVGEYQAGHSFGELALLYSAQRAASILALEDCVLWSVDSRTFHRLVIKNHRVDSSERLQFLKKVPLLQGLILESLAKMADALQVVSFEKDARIINEGEKGEDFFIIESGEVKCTHTTPTRGEQFLITLSRGDYFGEMALMLDEPRHANVIATEATTCYRITRFDFVRLFGSLQELLQQQMRIRILKSVPLLSHLPDQVLDKLADAMRIQMFRPGKYVLKQGDAGSRFYIINEGSARITTNVVDAEGVKTGEVECRIMRAQEFFGERALINHKARTANVIAVDKLECLVLDRDSFLSWLQNAEAFKKKRKENLAKPRPLATDLQRVRTLGTGTFGRVSLVTHARTHKVYALKAMQKEQIVKSHQERNIMNEKNLLLLCEHPMVLALVATYQDTDNVYMLMEIVQGGELWSLVYEKVAETSGLRDARVGGFDNATSRFYAGCVVEAFEHIHGHGIAYRDLKPENLLIDALGYVKVIDFGFAKKVPWEDKKGYHDKSYTICGTPEYLAPEIIQSKGHDKAVDYWALGCLVFELLVGHTPFADERQPEIFRKVLASETLLDKADTWPVGMDAGARELVRGLIRPNSLFRLGAGCDGVGGIRNCAWYAEAKFNWQQLRAKTMPAPFLPSIGDPLDTSNFDSYDEVADLVSYGSAQDVFADWSAMGADFPPQRA